MADVRGSSCDYTYLISVLQVIAEIILKRARHTGSCRPCVSKIRINGEYTSLLLVGGMVVQVDGHRRKAGVVVNRNGIGQVTFSAEFATGSNDGSYSVANPFVRLQRKLQVVESADGEGESFLPLPIGRVEIQLGVRHDFFWELGMDRNDSCDGEFYHDWAAGGKDVNRRGQ